MITVLLAVRDDALRHALSEAIRRVTDRVIAIPGQQQAASAVLAIGFDVLIFSRDPEEYVEGFIEMTKLIQPSLTAIALSKAGAQDRMPGVDLFLEIPFEHETLVRLLSLAGKARPRLPAFDSIFNPQ